MNEYPILSTIKSPNDLKKLDEKQLAPLANEIRAFLVDKVTKSGGHLASNLGVVELSVALHRVFQTPADRIIWDVSHQSYVHKMLTGRLDKFDTLRTPGGLSGFCRREESEYDAFGCGHSSTSLSAAIGFANADRLQGRSNTTIAVIGDGAFSGGMVHEALNNCRTDLRLIVVLNENEMSIGKTTGAFARYISKMRSTASYYRLKRRTVKLLRHIPLLGKLIYKCILNLKIFMKNLIYGTNYYEDLGFFYMGPINGHDTEALEEALKEAKRRSSAVLLHIKTTKGKGYAPAETEPGKFHSVYPNEQKTPAFHDAFGDMLVRQAQEDDGVVAITAAMESGTGLRKFASEFPSRFFDVGIAEEHAVTFAAGLAAGGMKPYVAIYSTFLQRGYDQILHDVALQRLGVRFIVDRAGLSASDGATHHGIFDVSFMSSIPGISIYSPMTIGSLRAVMAKIKNISSPCAVRYPNENEDPNVVKHFYPDGNYRDFGVRSDSDPQTADGVIITYGSSICRALAAQAEMEKEDRRIAVILLEQLAPYPDIAKRIYDLLPFDGPVVFLEDGIYRGGAGMNLETELIALDYMTAERFSILAVKDKFGAPVTPVNLYEYCSVSTDDILRVLKKAFFKK